MAVLKMTVEGKTSEVKTSTEIKNALEHLLDSGHKISDILFLLEEIANLKADHLQTNWQDAPSARAFEKAARILETSAYRLERTGF